MTYPTEDDFPDWQSENYEDLAEKFFENNKQMRDKFEEFCWEKFESHRQNYDDYIADAQIEDKLMEKND